MAPLDHPYWSDAAPCSMHIDEVEAIWNRIDEADDWSALHAKVEGGAADGRRAGGRLTLAGRDGRSRIATLKSGRFPSW